MTTEYRVHFIGSGYESIRFVIVNAKSYRDAMTKAAGLYRENNWTFAYCGMEVEAR